MPALLQREGKTQYEFSSKPWPCGDKGAWYFLTLPKDLAREIRESSRWQEEGWGRLKVTAKTGDSQWETAIWFDTKHDTYLLPLKAAIRKKEKIDMDQNVSVTLLI